MLLLFTELLSPIAHMPPFLTLTPGAYVGVAEAEDDGVDFHERMNEIHAELKRLNDEANVLMGEILKGWEELK